jgi:hypothetical protein
MHLLALATFRFDSGDHVTAIAAATVDPERIRDIYRRRVLPFALQAFGQEVLHSSAVETDRGIVAFCAHSETGKSTLAYGLHRRGYTLWADDAVVFRASSRVILATSLPFRVRLRPASWSYFARDGHLVEPGAEVERSGSRQRPLAAVFALERSGDSDGAPVEVQRLPAGEALPAVLAHALSLVVDDPPRKRLLVEQYLALVAGVPVFRLRFPADLDRLVQTLDQVEKTIA